jgi:hypothetical protein
MPLSLLTQPLVQAAVVACLHARQSPLLSLTVNILSMRAQKTWRPKRALVNAVTKTFSLDARDKMESQCCLC